MTLSVAHEGKGKQKRGSDESPAKGRGDHGLRRLGAKLRALCQFVAGVGGKITDSDGKGKMLYLLKTSSNFLIQLHTGGKMYFCLSKLPSAVEVSLSCAIRSVVPFAFPFHKTELSN
jgi:hypothetical protein